MFPGALYGFLCGTAGSHGIGYIRAGHIQIHLVAIPTGLAVDQMPVFQHGHGVRVNGEGFPRAQFAVLNGITAQGGTVFRVLQHIRERAVPRKGHGDHPFRTKSARALHHNAHQAAVHVFFQFVLHHLGDFIVRLFFIGCEHIRQGDLPGRGQVPLGDKPSGFIGAAVFFTGHQSERAHPGVRGNMFRHQRGRGTVIII